MEVVKMTITVDFKNILSELKLKNLKICFLKKNIGRCIFIEDSQNNLYQMEVYRQVSYLDNLIKNGIVVNFHQVKMSLSKNIRDWEKEIWSISEVEAFMKRQSLYW
jgi:hypothetical protein